VSFIFQRQIVHCTWVEL